MASPELASTIRATPDHTSRERDVNRRYGTLSSRNLRPSAGYKDLHVKQQEQVNARETYVLVGTRDGLPPVQLYFDQQSGLLVRVLRFVETPLGRNPTQIDYADYREENGVKTPCRWTVARPNGRFTIQIEQMQQNVPIKDDKFAKPVAPSSE